MVHSAFRRLSHAGLRAEIFCKALLDSIPDGTLLMPAMTWRSVTPATPVFDELKTPSHTGILTEIFRVQYATHRSLHPTHSVAGAGLLASFLLSQHHQGTTPCASNSPYGLMRAYDTHILLLDVGLDCCTAIHHAEEMIAPELYLRPAEQSEVYDLIDRHGVIHRVATRRHSKLPRDFPKFEQILAQRNLLSSGVAYDMRWMFFSLNDLYQVVFSALAKRSDATLSARKA